MNTFDTDPKRLDNGIEVWKDRIEIWFNRAAVSYKQDQIEVCKDALNRRWSYQQILAELEGTEPPDPPNEPEFYFGKRGRYNRGVSQGGRGPSDPDQPAPVPRRPFPNTGAGEIGLPEPFPGGA